MYQIVVRTYSEDWDVKNDYCVKQDGFKQSWAEEEFWANTDTQEVVYETEDFNKAVDFFVDCEELENITVTDNTVNIVVYGFYDSDKKKFWMFSNCEIEPNSVICHLTN